jgi:hypothetical protein
MTTIFTHYLILHAVPLACGLTTGWIACVLGGRAFIHAVLLASAMCVAMLLQYAGLLVMAGIQTGAWPTGATLNGFAYALAWFAIPAAFTTVPLTLVGHTATAIAVRQWRRSARPQTSHRL